MAESRMRFGSSSSNASPSKVPLARISEVYDPDFDATKTEDQNHNMPSTAASREPCPSELSTDGDQGFNPIWPISVAYFGSALLFLVGLNVSGLSLLSFPWIGNLLWYDYQDLKFVDGVIILQFMWCGHYVRRFAETLFVHIFHRKMPFFETIGAQVYYWMFGFWIGWSINLHLGYRVPQMFFFVPGVLLFIMGELGNCYCHWLLRQMRLKPSGQAAISRRKRIIPYGFLFTYITYPHYMFEIISWTGFYLATHTMASGLFLLFTIITVTMRAVQGHKQLKKEFNGVDGNPLFPASRKAIFPFVL